MANHCPLRSRTIPLCQVEEFFIQRATQVLIDTVNDVADDTFFFATSSTTQGPNVLRNGTFQGDTHIEPHQQWATGLLVDNAKLANSTER